MKPNKGFSLIELLIAMLILMFVMIGFLAGLIKYIQFSIDARMKDLMDKAVKDWSGYLESLPYNASCSPVGYSFGSAVCDLSTNQCSFENIDSDGDGIPDFYDPYSGNNNNYSSAPLSTASWLWVGPTIANLTCNNYPHPTTYSLVGNRRVYTALTVATITATGGAEMGRAYGITAWYFSPIDRRYKYESSLLIKRKP
ncbi:prepilin-type N-terminal cleavage/methylation domain-containing protein [Hydrogenobacter hydrogenophilus]|uniref:Prepilin-type N-terminal cleavage/methylation domain-containing protein n=1 Tax=Hydrogenobacter hydrogenophilus TaxID=35835 RepID=A0A285NRR4_9AQUI|nr:prepilin-type N-terminal cleavage/methylation domain-containing protein [Hydrogenobacter hydrogenophilus]SNZ12202.1 prepilin-type N-terminal cleavage/methylation domain-containing protein [Hydrogenobacter hydrogenophilus]